jgi:hypothetical protein
VSTRKKITKKTRPSASGDDAWTQATARSRALVEARRLALWKDQPYPATTRIKTLDSSTSEDRAIIVSGSWPPPSEGKKPGPQKDAKTWEMIYQLAVSAVFGKAPLDFDRRFADKYFPKVEQKDRLRRLRSFRSDHKADIRAAVTDLQESIHH